MVLFVCAAYCERGCYERHTAVVEHVKMSHQLVGDSPRRVLACRYHQGQQCNSTQAVE